MKVDLKEKIKNEKMMRELPNNHRKSFGKRLQNELHEKPKSSYTFLKIAASVLLIFSLGYYAITNKNETVQNEIVIKSISLSEFSPELKKIENYYLTAINYEIANLEVTEDDKLVLESFFIKIENLTSEYKALNKKLDINKMDEDLINSLIDNLQLRLHLLVELKNKLKNLKTDKNENRTI